jgi:hypothetical protein
VNQDGEKVTTEVTQKQLCYFPITPRLKWLFISKRTAWRMRLHKEGIRENDGVMGHPSDGEAWKVLNRFDGDFDSDARNVNFGLVIDGFDPFSTNSTPYSCWPIFAVPYNLPPSLCLKFEFMFLCLIVPGPEPPGPQIHVTVIRSINLTFELRTCGRSMISRHTTFLLGGAFTENRHVRYVVQT